MNSKIFGFLFFSFLILIIIVPPLSKRLDPSRNSPYLKIEGEFIELAEIKLISKDFNTNKYEGSFAGTILKVTEYTNQTDEQSEKTKDKEIFRIFAMYDELHSPYPGALSNRIACPMGYQPVEHNGSQQSYFSLYATDRFTYGACSPDIITYRSIVAFLKCDSNLYKLQYFYQINISDFKLPDVSCR